jgi:hypothetical protein
MNEGTNMKTTLKLASLAALTTATLALPVAAQNTNAAMSACRWANAVHGAANGRQEMRPHV